MKTIKKKSKGHMNNLLILGIFTEKKVLFHSVDAHIYI